MASGKSGETIKRVKSYLSCRTMRESKRFSPQTILDSLEYLDTVEVKYLPLYVNHPNAVFRWKIKERLQEG